MLRVGQKRWMLKSPAVREVSTVHPAEWLNNTESNEQQRSTDDLLGCTQQGGQLLYVPHMWAHAVANVKDGLAVALEFSECAAPLLDLDTRL